MVPVPVRVGTTGTGTGTGTGVIVGVIATATEGSAPMLLSWQLDLVLLVATWTVLHFLAPAVLKLALSQSGVPGLSRRVSECLTKLPAERQRVLRRYVRAQIYYCLAGPLGIMLITRCHSFESLLHMHTDLHDRAFALAASHWVVSLIEDWSTPHSFSIRLRKPPKNGRDPPSLYRLYLVHHLVAIVAFVVCLSTRSLPALGACGLLFELPVLFVNVRDLVRDFEPELQWFGALGGWALIDFCWSAGFLAMLVGRLGPVALYLYGLWHWSDPGGVGSVAVPCRVAYVLLGGFFSGLSVLWIAFMQYVAGMDNMDLEASEAQKRRRDAKGGGDGGNGSGGGDARGDGHDDNDDDSVGGGGSVSDAESDAPLVSSDSLRKPDVALSSLRGGTCPFTGARSAQPPPPTATAGLSPHGAGVEPAHGAKDSAAAQLIEETKR